MVDKKEYKVRVKQDNKHWTITKSLDDFAQLSRELERQYPNLCPAESATILQDKDESAAQKDPTKQRHLEQFLRVYPHPSFRDSCKTRTFATPKVSAISSVCPKSSLKKNRLPY